MAIKLRILSRTSELSPWATKMSKLKKMTLRLNVKLLQVKLPTLKNVKQVWAQISNDVLLNVLNVRKSVRKKLKLKSLKMTK